MNTPTSQTPRNTPASQTPYVGHSSHREMLNQGFRYERSTDEDGVTCDVYTGHGFIARMNAEGRSHSIKTEDRGLPLNWRLLSPLEG